MHIDTQLEDRVALITGGSRGIGRAMGLLLAQHGVHVALCGRNADTLEATADEIRASGVNAWPMPTDVSRPHELKAFVANSAARAGRIDILVNNAVTSRSAPFAEQTDEDWQYHVDVKLLAYIRAAREVLPFMQHAGWGRIVNIGGMTARIVAPLRITNGIVNAGVSNFTKQLAQQVGSYNVTVNCVHPGYTLTERMLQNVERRARDAGVETDSILAETIKEIPLGRLVQPEDIANAALFFCSPMADAITGQNIAVDGGSGQAINY
ncbi:MAG: SDR family oxidoreductase [Pseudomonadota bacterium]